MKNTDSQSILSQLRQQILTGQYRPGEKLPTEMELAKRFGVSRSTGADALNTLAREGLVQRAPRRGTIVNRRLPVSQTGAKPLLAWIQPDLDLFAVEILRGCAHAAQKAGYNLLFQQTSSSLSEEAAIHNALLAGVHGIALYPQDGEIYNVEVLRLVIDKFPLVLLDRYLQGIDCAAVYCDNVGGASTLVENLIKAGHRHICAMAYPPKGTSSIEERLEGYTQALTAAGIPLDMSLIYVENESQKLLYNWHISNDRTDYVANVDRFVQYLHKKPEITAIFATNEGLAQIAMLAAERMKLSIPQDLSMACFNSAQLTLLLSPLFTCAYQHAFNVGETAVELLREQIAGQAPRKVVMPVNIRDVDAIMPPRSRIVKTR